MHAATSYTPATSTRKLHVLVAEDNPVNQKLAVLTLQRLGHTGMLVNDGEKALQCLARHRFDLVLMDDHMPHMDGMQALAAIRSDPLVDQSGMPVIVVTANDLPGDRERYLLRGANGYIAKPMQAHTLQQEIARVLETAPRYRSTEHPRKSGAFPAQFSKACIRE